MKPNLKQTIYFHLLVIILTSTMVNAQDANEIRKKAEKVNTEQLNTVYTNNLPNSKSSSSSLSAEELQELAAKMKRDRESNNSYVDKRTEAQKEAERQEIATMHYNRTKRNAELVKSYGEKAEENMQLGFTSQEAYRLSRYSTLEPDGDTKGLEAVNNAKDAFVLFKENFESATFDELCALAQSFKLATYSCIVALRKIETRFPERKSALDTMVRSVLPHFYGYNGVTDKLQDYEHINKVQGDYVATQFTQLFELDPIATNNAAFKCIESPYDSYIASVWIEKNKNKLSDKFLMILRSEEVKSNKIDPNEYYDASYYKRYYQDDIHKLAGCAKYFRAHREHLKKLTVTDWQAISRAKGIAATDIMPYLVISAWEPHRTLRTFEAYYENRDGSFDEFYFFNEGYGFPDMIKQLALAGDPAAMNAYGVRIVSRIAKTAKIPQMEAVDWFIKASKAGDFAAVINLCRAFDRDVPGYDSDENADRIADEIVRYFEAADAETAYRGAMTYTEGVSWESVLSQKKLGYIFGKKVLNIAAEKGSAKAIKILKDYPGLKL